MDIKDIFKMGYFIVYKGNDSWLARQIWREQMEEGHNDENARYAHVEVSGGGYDSINVNFPRARVIDIRKVHGGVYAKLIRFKASDYEVKRYKVAYFAAADNGKIYGWWSLLWWQIKDWPILRKFLKKRLFPAAVFCSYSCANALEHEYPLHKKADEWMPADFLNESYFETVWEGTIPEYTQGVFQFIKRQVLRKGLRGCKTILGMA